MDRLKVGIIGASGYAGVELIRLLLQHPGVKIAALSSVSYEGQKISDLYPNLSGICEMTLGGEEALVEASDLVFAAVPHGLSESIAALCQAKGKKCVDLGADFRLDDETVYQQWYGKGFDAPTLHQDAIYGLPELNREKIKTAWLVGNPGCYPTASALGLAPVFQKYGVLPLVIDAKSGVTGAGRSPSATTHFPQCNESIAPYSIASHRHTPEIEQTLSALAGAPVRLTFVPHLLPVNRGILMTAYVDLPQLVPLKELYELYRQFYQNEFFVRVLPVGGISSINKVRLSNYCDISLHLDERTNRLIVVSAIDNMVKGAAGQAIQNMNLMTGLGESLGLEQAPIAF